MSNYNRTLLSHAIILISSTCLFYSCGNDSKKIYIISKEDSIMKVQHTTKNGIVLIQPQCPYGTYNFIIDDNNDCFFYAFQSPRKNPPGIVGDDSDAIFTPVFLNLLPNNIFRIPKDYEQMFVEENVLKAKTTVTKTIVVSSFKDTINNPIVSYLRQLKSDTSKHISLYIRRATKEEQVVVNYKLQGKYYTLPVQVPTPEHTTK